MSIQVQGRVIFVRFCVGKISSLIVKQERFTTRKYEFSFGLRIKSKFSSEVMSFPRFRFIMFLSKSISLQTGSHLTS